MRNESDAWGVDLRRIGVAKRNAAVGESIALAREVGLEIKHRPQGWSLREPGGQWINFWPVDVNLFVDHIADYARAKLLCYVCPVPAVRDGLCERHAE